MKKVLFLFFSITTLLSAQWESTKGPYGGMIYPLCSNQSTVFAATRIGIFRTSNEGALWEKSNNGLPEFLSALTMASNGTEVFVGTEEGVFISRDNGTNWIPINNGLPSASNVLAAHGNNVFSGNKEGIFRSTDLGNQWLNIYNQSVQSIYINDTLFLAGTSTGVIFSTDSGETWKHSAPLQSVISVLVVGKKIFAGSLYGGLFISSDYGSSWLSITNGIDTLYAVYSLTNIDSTIFARQGSNIIRSTNNGVSWTKITSGEIDLIVKDGTLFTGSYLIVIDSTLFTGSLGAGVFSSSDKGNTWIQSTKGIYGISSSLISTNNTLFAGTDGNGLYKYTDNNWAPVNNAIISIRKYIRISALSEHKTNIYCGQDAPYDGKIRQDDDTAGIFVSSNYGGEWVNISNSILGRIEPKIFSFSDTEIFLGCYYVTDEQFYKGLIYRSTNGGQNWEKIYLEEAFSGITALIVTQKYIIGGDDYGAFRTKLDTISWNRIDIFEGHILNSIIRSGEYLYACADGKLLFYSTDEGENWYQRNLDIEINHLYGYQKYLFAAGSPEWYSDKVYKSDDYGKTWTSYSTGLPLYLYVENFCVNENFLYATTSHGVWKRSLSDLVPVELSSFSAALNKEVITLNWITATEKNNKGFDIQRKLSGEVWKSIGYVAGKGTVTTTSNYEFRDEIKDLSYNGTLFYRLKQYDFDGTSEVSKEVNVKVNFIPENYALSQNYPNPFNPTTVIKYSIPFESNIVFSIYNSLGQKVKEYSEGIKAPGNYEVNLNLSELASGVYFYSITASSTDGKNNFNAIKKMIVIK